MILSARGQLEGTLAKPLKQEGTLAPPSDSMSAPNFLECSPLMPKSQN